jgi:hypothetical protein
MSILALLLYTHTHTVLFQVKQYIVNNIYIHEWENGALIGRIRALVAVTLYWFPSLYLGKIS